MATLKELLSDLAKVDGVSSAVVVSRDGFVIEGTTANSLDVEAVGAVVSAGIGASEVMGSELQVGEMTQSMVEFKNGVVVTSFLGEVAILAVVAGLKANLGNIRFQVKRRGPEIERAL